MDTKDWFLISGISSLMLASPGMATTVVIASTAPERPTQFWSDDIVNDVDQASAKDSVNEEAPRSEIAPPEVMGNDRIESDRIESDLIAEAPVEKNPIEQAVSPSEQPPKPDLPVVSEKSTVPRLYGEAALDESEIDAPATAARDDLEQMSQEEWMSLILGEEEQLDEDELTSSSESAALVDSEFLRPVPQQVSQQQASPHLVVEETINNQSDELAEEPFEVLEELEELNGSLNQLTSVAQLSDVQPTDWSYQALQSLVERYGIIAGYPDGTFQGDRPLSRYEFAAALNAAVDRITELLPVAGAEGEFVSREDLATLQRLQQDFAAELSNLQERVDSLEAETAELEAQQFSTTVRLNGQVIMALANGWGGAPPGLGETDATFDYLTQFQLSGSFSGRDVLRVGFDASDAGIGYASPTAFNTNMALLSYQSDTNDQFRLSSLEYRAALNDRIVVTIKPAGFSLSSVLTPNTIFSSSSQGALSRFASENPIFRIGALDAGVGFDVLLADPVRLQVAYGARNAAEPDQGIFSSNARALGVQLLLRPASTVTMGLAYVNAFNEFGFLDTFTGSNNADTSGGFLEPATIHAVSTTLQWQITPNIIFGAWGGLTATDSLPSDAAALSTTYLFSLGFPDTFGREGDLLGIMVGQPLRLQAGINILREDEAGGMHYEAFYRFRLNDYISITPGLFIVTDPGHIASNNTIVIGAIRTSFNF